MFNASESPLSPTELILIIPRGVRSSSDWRPGFVSGPRLHDGGLFISPETPPVKGQALQTRDRLFRLSERWGLSLFCLGPREQALFRSGCVASSPFGSGFGPWVGSCHRRCVPSRKPRRPRPRHLRPPGQPNPIRSRPRRGSIRFPMPKPLRRSSRIWT